jgi:methionine-rich copper-binding protein CopC
VVAVAAAMVLALLSVPAAPAGAHSVFVGSEPEAGATVGSLDQVRLLFAYDVDPAGDHRVVVETAQGAQIPAREVSVPEPTTVAAAFDGVGEGAVEVVWEIVAADGHRESGRIPLTVAAPPVSPPPGGAAPPEPAPVPEPLLAGTTPAPGQRVTALDEVRLDFARDLTPGQDHLVLVRTDGGEVVTPQRIDRPDDRTLVASFDGVPGGEHDVVWEARAADDGRVESGRFPVTVEPAPPRDEPASPVLWAALAALVLAAGAGLAWRATRRRTPAEARQPG